jgi:hypothetical protein
LSGLSFEGESRKSTAALLLARQETSADTEVMQLRGNSRLAGESDGIGPRQQLPAQSIAEHKRSHCHPAQRCQGPRLCFVAQLSKTTRERWVWGGRLEFPK